LKLPYYMFFGKDTGRLGQGLLRQGQPQETLSRQGQPQQEPLQHGPPLQEAPRNMLVAMGLAAAACILIGIFPGLLYQQLPNPVHFVPYTLQHVTSTLGMLSFTALGFFLLLKHLDPEPAISLDTDWFYRLGAAGL